MGAEQASGWLRYSTAIWLCTKRKAVVSVDASLSVVLAAIMGTQAVIASAGMIGVVVGAGDCRSHPVWAQTAVAMVCVGVAMLDWILVAAL